MKLIFYTFSKGIIFTIYIFLSLIQIHRFVSNDLNEFRIITFSFVTSSKRHLIFFSIPLSSPLSTLLFPFSSDFEKRTAMTSCRVKKREWHARFHGNCLIQALNRCVSIRKKFTMPSSSEVSSIKFLNRDSSFFSLSLSLSISFFIFLKEQIFSKNVCKKEKRNIKRKKKEYRERPHISWTNDVDRFAGR